MSIIQSGQNKTDVLNGKVRIEDGNQRLIAENDDGTTIILGKGKTGNYGISYYDAIGNLISKNDGATDFKYDASNNLFYKAGLISTGEYGTGYYDTSGNLISKTIGAKTTYYTSAGVKTSDNDGTTINYYNSSGTVITKITPTKTTYYTDAGVKTSEMTPTSNTYYNSSGEIISTTTPTKSVYYDSTNARILIGQNPSDSIIGIWISKFGKDVITELAA